MASHALSPVLARLGRSVVDLLLPPACAGCGAATGSPDGLCAPCWSRIDFIAPPVCEVYGTPFSYEMAEGMLSAAAIADPPPFDKARAAALYGPVAKSLVHQLKYRDRPEVAKTIAQAMCRAGSQLLAESDLIVPVPLHRFRLWRRRFNQSAVLAHHVSGLARVPCDPWALDRVRATRQQVGMSKTEREANVRGAFRVPQEKRAAIAGRRILLVDDVYTSGATVKAATRALRRAGARAVFVLTFARVAH
jgi:ComF family protein